MIAAYQRLPNYWQQGKGTAVLSGTEANVIVAVMTAGMLDDQRGTIKISTQRARREEEVILLCNMPGGGAKTSKTDSDCAVGRAVGVVTKLDKPQGVYLESGARILVLKNGAGRVFVAIAGDFGDSPEDSVHTQNYLLALAAEALLQLRKNDETLRASIEEVELVYEGAAAEVAEVFAGGCPEITAWRKWHAEDGGDKQ